MKTRLLTFGILVAGFISGPVLASVRAAEPGIPPDSLRRSMVQVEFNKNDLTWNLKINGYQSGDTLTLPDWIVQPGNFLSFGCCQEVIGWHNPVSGLNAVIPEGYQKTDTIALSFTGDRVPVADRPVVVVSGMEIEESFRFSRTTEVRLQGDNIFYNFQDHPFSKQWLPYTRPLLINRAMTLHVVNTAENKAPSPPALLRLIKISDFERIESSPLPTSAATPDQMFRLVDADTTSLVEWNSCPVEILLNPGVARIPATLTIWFAAIDGNASEIPDCITLEGSDDGLDWKTIAKNRPDQKKMATRPVVRVELPASEAPFRYFKITMEGAWTKLAIGETALKFSH